MPLVSIGGFLWARRGAGLAGLIAFGVTRRVGEFRGLEAGARGAVHRGRARGALQGEEFHRHRGVPRRRRALGAPARRPRRHAYLAAGHRRRLDRPRLFYLGARMKSWTGKTRGAEDGRGNAAGLAIEPIMGERRKILSKKIPATGETCRSSAWAPGRPSTPATTPRRARRCGEVLQLLNGNLVDSSPMYGSSESVRRSDRRAQAA